MAEERAADWFQLEVAAGVILSGGVILHATEGVWGLACDPFSEAAVRRISSMKRRQAGIVLRWFVKPTENWFVVHQPA